MDLSLPTIALCYFALYVVDYVSAHLLTTLTDLLAREGHCSGCGPRATEAGAVGGVAINGVKLSIIISAQDLPPYGTARKIRLRNG